MCYAVLLIYVLSCFGVCVGLDLRWFGGVLFSFSLLFNLCLNYVVYIARFVVC